jgi:hypothetical protein
MKRWWQPFPDVAGLVNLTALDRGILELPTDFKNLPGQLFGEKLSRLNHL